MTELSSATAASRELEILTNPDSLAARVADWLLAKATATPGRFAVALSGGSTPRRLYQRLSKSPYLERFPWTRTHWFWGDERFVPHADAQSNYRMTRNALLAHAPIPDENIHAIPTEGLEPSAAALAYQETLQSFYGAERLDPTRALFDVILLGLGADGHTASLFPGTAALAEQTAWVAAVADAKGQSRITLTYPAISSSRNLAFLVTGPDKAEILDRLFHGDQRLPAARVRSLGDVWIFADAAAATAIAQ